ncbi:hypothetical protein AGMMS49556_08140 [Endomicrobiia bacterium]|nr:hypothetical protein AGMMS49556_08140 [Endomicrobiia bacterium]
MVAFRGGSYTVIIFAFGGPELIGIAAAETSDPQKTISYQASRISYFDFLYRPCCNVFSIRHPAQLKY